MFRNSTRRNLEFLYWKSTKFRHYFRTVHEHVNSEKNSSNHESARKIFCLFLLSSSEICLVTLRLLNRAIFFDTKSA